MCAVLAVVIDAESKLRLFWTKTLQLIASSWHGDGAGNTVENSSVFSLIQMR